MDCNSIKMLEQAINDLDAMAFERLYRSVIPIKFKARKAQTQYMTINSACKQYNRICNKIQTLYYNASLAYGRASAMPALNAFIDIKHTCSHGLGSIACVEFLPRDVCTIIFEYGNNSAHFWAYISQIKEVLTYAKTEYESVIAMSPLWLSYSHSDNLVNIESFKKYVDSLAKTEWIMKREQRG